MLFAVDRRLYGFRALDHRRTSQNKNGKFVKKKSNMAMRLYQTKVIEGAL
jgi:hypothetical protein